jgi:hypothetical protein
MNTGELGSGRNRGGTSVIQSLAEDLDLDAAVVARHENAAAHGCGNDRRRVGAEAVRFRKRTRGDDSEIRATIDAALDPDERLSGDLIDALLRQKHRERVVLRRGRVEHRAADRVAIFFALFPQLVQRLEQIVWDELHGLAARSLALRGVYGFEVIVCHRRPPR